MLFLSKKKENLCSQLIVFQVDLFTLDIAVPL